MLALKRHFRMVQRARVLNGPAQQRRQRHQFVNIFPLAGLGIKMQERRGLDIKKLQYPLLIPRHHAIIHALQQAIHLVEMTVRFGQQAVGQQRVAHFPGDSQRQRQIRGGLLFDQTAQRDGAKQATVVIKHRRGAK